MTIPLPDETKRSNPKRFRRLILLLCLPVLGCLALYLFEIFPRYIILPIPAPDAYEETYLSAIWETTSYTVTLQPAFPPYIDSRVFIWRKETGGLFNKEHHMTSWQDIVGYFDANLERYGWTRTDAYTPCRFYLPEANFLPAGDGGYVWYRETGYQPMFDFHGGNFLCLAVQPDPNNISYRVVIISVSQSPLNYLLSIS